MGKNMTKWTQFSISNKIADNKKEPLSKIEFEES